MEKTDQELIFEYKEGNKRSLETLIDRHLKSVYNFAFRMTGSAADADDVSQESFLKAWKNINKYNPELSFRTWLLSITRNASIDFLRKRKGINFSELDQLSDGEDKKFEDTIVDSELLPDAVFERKEIETVAQRALESIPIPMKEVVLLHLAEGLTFEEIAKALKEPMNTVKSRYRRALESIRKFLTGDIAPK